MRVKYIRKGEYKGNALTLEKEYVVLAIEYDGYRILDDLDEPFLYPSSQFTIVDPDEPTFWVETVDEDGDRCKGPRKWAAKPYMFEDYHDGVDEAVEQFWSDCEVLYSIKQK